MVATGQGLENLPSYVGSQVGSKENPMGRLTAVQLSTYLHASFSNCCGWSWFYQVYSATPKVAETDLSLIIIFIIDKITSYLIL